MTKFGYIRGIKFEELTFERVYEALYRRAIDIPHRIAWSVHTSFWKQNYVGLLSHRNKHKGERCFIIANGPSLKDTDLTLLRNEYTIGMNRIYLHEQAMGFLPTYLVVFDVAVQLKQFAHEIQKVNTVKFLNWNARKLFNDYTDTYFFRQSFKTEFSCDFSRRVYGGHSVTNVCLQLAYFLGFKDVILVGKDHSYAQTGIPGQLRRSDGNEDNHFVKGYYRKGMVWRIPDYKGEELSYRMAKDAFESDNRRVLDATINGKLNVFEKVEYESLF